MPELGRREYPLSRVERHQTRGLQGCLLATRADQLGLTGAESTCHLCVAIAYSVKKSPISACFLGL